MMEEQNLPFVPQKPVFQRLTLFREAFSRVRANVDLSPAAPNPEQPDYYILTRWMQEIARTIAANPGEKGPAADDLSPLEAALLRWHDSHQQYFETCAGWIIARSERHSQHYLMLACLHYLSAQFGADLGNLAADLYFSSQRWLPRYHYTLGMQISTILNACLVLYTPVDILQRIEAHVTTFYDDFIKYDAYLTNNTSAMSMLLQQFYRGDDSLQYWSPGSIAACFDILVGLTLDMEGRELAIRWYHYIGNRGFSLFNVIEEVITLSLLKTLTQAFTYEQLSYTLFQKSALLIPDLLIHSQYSCIFSQLPAGESREKFFSTLLDLRQRFLVSSARELTSETCYIFMGFKDKSDADEMALHGSEWLLLAAYCHSQHNASTLVSSSSSSYYTQTPIQQVIERLAEAYAIEPGTDAERQRLIAQLQCYPGETLKGLFPIAIHGRKLLLDALGWSKTYILIEYIHSLSNNLSIRKSESLDNQDGALNVIATSIPIDEVRTLNGKLDAQQAAEVLQLMRNAKSPESDTACLIAAVAGWNRAAVLKSLKHNALIAIEAYGLLPLERGQDEVLERYLVLQEKYKCAPKLGAQRRFSQREAVRKALNNLAFSAHYTDVSLLELEMELKTSADKAPDGRTWQIGEYTLRLSHQGLDVALKVLRKGNELKTIAPAVRKSSEYKEAKELVKVLHDQARRLRINLLEKLLVTGSSLSLAHLKLLVRLPATRAMLERLLLSGADGEIGLFVAETFSLQCLDGTIRLVNTAVHIVHPYTLHERDLLAAWQREIVHRRIVQPFKQVFRELYLLTPAEREARLQSLRFAGHSVDGSMAYRLLASRQWRFEHDRQAAYKIYPGLRAIFTLLSHSSYPMGEPITTNYIHFERYPWWGNAVPASENIAIPLEEVPALIFSEVMRDADLVVSTAKIQESGRILLSDEAYVLHGELISALLADLDLKGVKISGHFAYVQGKLACYRIHLGSAAVHIEPGSYLCIVPATWGQSHEQLFLPFLNEGDSKVSEIISKVLLLLADDQIEDESILRQIRTHAPRWQG